MNIEAQDQLPEDVSDAIIGRFIRQANTIEYMVNVCIECIIEHHASSLDNPATAHDTIDHIEEQSIRTRLNIITLFINMKHGHVPRVKELLKELREFYSYYNKEVRTMRDFVAHNPLFASLALVVSSRRYQGKLNSISIHDIDKKNKEMVHSVMKINELSAQIQFLFPAEPMRELFKK